MSIKQPIYHEFDLNATSGNSRVISLTHTDDAHVDVIELCVKQQGAPVDIAGATVIARMVLHSTTDVLLNDSVPCTINDAGNILIPFDNAAVQTRKGIVKIEVNITRTPDILTLQLPLWVKINGSILDSATVDPHSEGTIPELLKDAADALEEATEALEHAGDYDNLEHKPSINGHTLSDNKTSADLDLQGKLTAGTNITLESDGTISASGGVTSYNDLTDKPLIEYYMGNGGYSTAAFTGTLLAGLSGPIIISKIGTGLNNKFYIGLDPTQVFLVKTATSYDIDTTPSSPFFLALAANRLTHLPSFVSPKSGTRVSLLNLAGDNVIEQIQLLFWRDSNNGSHYAFRVFGASWQEIGGGSQIVSAVVNANGTITFTNSDGNTFTTSGSSVIGFSPTATVTQTASGATVTITDKNGTTTANISNGAPGQDYVLTAQDKSDIADIVLNELPTTQGVLYGNTSN